MSDHIIHINTASSGEKYWIKLKRNNKYIPHKQCTKTTSFYQSDNLNEWQIFHSRKKTPKPPIYQPIYYWVVSEHNLFDVSDKSYRLFFTEPDTTQIENVDQNNYMAIDKDQQLRLIHIHLKHKGMKMTPTYYIARNIRQIEDALHFVKYCIVKTENNEQKLIES